MLNKDWCYKSIRFEKITSENRGKSNYLEYGTYGQSDLDLRIICLCLAPATWTKYGNMDSPSTDKLRTDTLCRHAVYLQQWASHRSSWP